MTAINPPLGDPPTIEWIGVDRLAVDESYQRSCGNPTSEKLIAKIAAGWDWRLFQPLSCARRANGSLVVIDGQHRLLGARSRGDILHLPCVVSAYENTAAEASAFAAMNRQRKGMTTLELWRAQIAAGDVAALQAEAVIKSAGLQLAAHTNPTVWKINQIACVAGVAHIIKSYGSTVAGRALRAMRQAWPDAVLTHAGSLLEPVATLATSDAAVAKIIVALKQRSQLQWHDIGRLRPDVMGQRARDAIRAQIAADMGVAAAVKAPVQSPSPASGPGWTMPPAPPPKRRKTFEEELAAVEAGTATFVERTFLPSRGPTEVPTGSSLA